MSFRFASVLLIVAALGCNGPIAVFPGGRLSGEVEPTPSNWGFAGEYGTFQLETRPEDPYSVNIAYTVIDGRFYVNAGDTETQWVKNMTDVSLVRIRLDGAIYELRAERVTDPEQIAAFAEAWTDQSVFRRDPTELDEVWIYELVAR